MKRVLVTGASGFIGRQALSALQARGYEVHAASLAGPRPGQLAAWHVADLLDLAQAEALMAAVRPTHWLHFAWYAVPGLYWNSPLNLRWVQSSLTLLTAFAQHGGRRAMLAGTCAEYDWQGDHDLLREADTPLRPRTLYGACKHSLRLMSEAYAALNDLSLAWGRIFFLYGPHEPAARLAPSVIQALLRGQPAETSHGRQVRDFLHVADVAEAFAATLDSPLTGAVNIGSGQAVTLKEVIETLAAQVGRPELVRLGARPAAPDEPARLAPDVTRLFHEVGWRPRYSLADGLADTIAWWRHKPA